MWGDDLAEATGLRKLAAPCGVPARGVVGRDAASKCVLSLRLLVPDANKSSLSEGVDGRENLLLREPFRFCVRRQQAGSILARIFGENQQNITKFAKPCKLSPNPCKIKENIK